MERLVLTLPCEHGELFYIISGRRVLLANCTSVIKIYERTTPMQTVGGFGIKSIHALLALCSNPEFTRPVDADFIKSVDNFDLSI